MTGRVALAWSGGKDSALALTRLRAKGIEPCALITTVTAAYERVSMHGVRVGLLRRQASALGIPLVEVRIPARCSNDVYEERMTTALSARPLADADRVAFGDIFLADVRAYRERQLEAAGRRGLFPLWGRDTRRLAWEFVAEGFEAVLVCVDPARLDGSFAGRRYDEALLAELAEGVDPSGENGEFHTFVSAGPIFAEPVAWEPGETVTRDGFVFYDLLEPVAASRLNSTSSFRGR